MFRVGQKVVCVNDKGWGAQPNLVSLPVYRGVYTIIEVRVRGSDTGLLLAEIRNPVTTFSNGQVGEPCFDASGFRPIVERKTDISIFTKMLTPNKRRVQERA